MTTRGWAITTDEGLTLVVNLTKDEAEQIAFERRLNGKLSWAVTNEEAQELQAEWFRLGEKSAAELRLKRMRVVTDLLREPVAR